MKEIVSAERQWATQWMAVKLIEPCRRIARQHGYALAEHGSKKRDVDWIAVPWIDDPATPRTLAEAIKAEIERVHEHPVYMGWEWCSKEKKEWEKEGSPGMKPFGRLTWTLHTWETYIDLSVVPPG